MLPTKWANSSPRKWPSASADTCSRTVFVCFISFTCLPSLAGLVVQQRLDLGRNRLAGPENPRSNGADRTVHDLGDFFVTHTLDFPQRHRLPEFSRQRFHGRLDSRRNFIGRQHGLGGLVADWF